MDRKILQLPKLSNTLWFQLIIQLKLMSGVWWSLTIIHYRTLESENGLGWNRPYSPPSPNHCHGLVAPYQLRLPGAPSMALGTSRDGAHTVSLANLFQFLTTLWVLNSFLTSNLNLSSFSLNPFPLILSLHIPVISPRGLMVRGWVQAQIRLVFLPVRYQISYYTEHLNTFGMSPCKQAKTQYFYSLWDLRWYLCLFLISSNCSDKTQ